jgi:uncharacterized protein YifN (PemK superfamily)
VFKLKYGKIYWVNFDQNVNKSSLAKKTRPAFIMAAHNDKGVFVIPLTSVEKRYHQKNKFAVKLSTDNYALCDQFEKVAATDRRIKNAANIQLTRQDILQIMFALEQYTSLSVNKKLPISTTIATGEHLQIGDTVVFKEAAKDGLREIRGIVAAIDDSAALTTNDDYVLVHVQSVVGRAKDAVYTNRSSLIRTRGEIKHGIRRMNELDGSNG